MRHLVTASLLVLGLAACSSSDSHQRVESREPIQHPEFGLISAQPVPGWEVFGADVPDRAPVPMKELVADAAKYTDQHVVAEGVIESVCPKKGCWMKFSAGGEQIRVKFKDYAFFVPKDAAGKTARVHGWFEAKELSVEEARHYLEDAGKHAEAAKITEPQREYSLYADGVRIAE